MLTFLSMLFLAQAVPQAIPPLDPPLQTPAVREILQPQQEIRPLPGQLDSVPVFNSNSPEMIQQPGILLSTFPGDGMLIPSAHLNYPLEGRFDIFAHHVARGINPDDTRTLYLGILVHNPTRRTITLDLQQAVSYLSQEAPFHDLPAYVANPLGTAYSGPGSRTMGDILRGERQPQWASRIEIPPQRTYLLANMPIPLRRLSVPTDGTLAPGQVLLPPPRQSPASRPGSASNSGAQMVSTAQTRAAQPDNRPIPLNGRTLMMHINSSGPVYVASLAMYAPSTADGGERVPSQSEWEQLLRTSDVAGPRDHPPTPPDARFFSRFFYGRVAGVAQGSQWAAQLTDTPDANRLTIPNIGEQVSYVLSTVDHNTFGTGQIQSAPMMVRYPDTAYRAHGNYGINYNLTLPLYNSTNSARTVGILLQTPLQDEDPDNALRFQTPPDSQIFFRGTVRLRYSDDFGIPQTRYLHLVQRRGQQGEPLIRLQLPPGDRRLVEVDLIYPPDATPPQVLTVQTLE